MRRRLHLPLALTVCLLASPLARAQAADETARETVARTLAAARESGAIDRILGTQYLHCAEEGREGLLELSGSYYGDPAAAEPEGLELTCTIHYLATDQRVRIAQRVDLSGQLIRCRVEGLAPSRVGRGTLDPQAVVEVDWDGARMRRRVTLSAGEPQEDDLAWDDDALPGLLVGWVLSSLHDQGLDVNLTFHLFTGVKLEDTDTRLTKHGIDERGFQVMRVITQMGPTGLVRYDVGLLVDGERKGQLAGGRFDIWGREAPLFMAVSAEEAAALVD